MDFILCSLTKGVLNSNIGANAEPGEGTNKVCVLPISKSKLKIMLSMYLKLLYSFINTVNRQLTGFVFTNVNKGFPLHKTVFKQF